MSNIKNQIDQAKRFAPKGQISIVTFDRSWRRKVLAFVDSADKAVLKYNQAVRSGDHNAVEVCVNDRFVSAPLPDPARCYLIHIRSHGETMIKVGISKGDSDYRFKDYPEQQTSKISHIKFDHREEAHDFEQSVLSKYSPWKFTPRIRFGGSTECLSTSALPMVLEEFDTYLKSIGA